MHHLHHSHVLQLDIQGTPQAWISLELQHVAVVLRVHGPGHRQHRRSIAAQGDADTAAGHHAE